MPEPAKKAAPKKASPQKAESLPTHKDDLAALAISRGIPSYEAWAMTVDELTEKLEG